MLALYLLAPLGALILLNLPFRKAVSRLAAGLTLGLATAEIALSLFQPSWLWTNEGPLATLLPAHFAIDPLSRIMLMAIGLIVGCAVLTGMSTIADDRRRFNFFNVLLLALIGMNGVVMVADLFTLYVFLEVTAVASFVLITIERRQAALDGAFRYVMLSAVASILMLAGIALLMMTSGGSDFETVSRVLWRPHVSGFPKIAVSLFVCGLFIKGGLVPFHGWVPAAYGAAPGSVSVLLAGIVTKVAGVYTLVRLVLSVTGMNPAIEQVLLVVGMASILVGALAALGQTDLKRLLAYSSISQMGYIVLGLACFGSSVPFAPLGITVGQLGLAGAILHFLNHAVFKALLFTNAAAVEAGTGTTDMRRLGGLSMRMPVTGFGSVVGSLSAAGVPPLGGFWSKFMIVLALWLSGFHAYAIVAVAASVLTLAYLLLAQRRVFFGKLPEGLTGVREAGTGAVLATVVLTALAIGVGVIVPFFAGPLLQFVLTGLQ